MRRFPAAVAAAVVVALFSSLLGGCANVAPPALCGVGGATVQGIDELHGDLSFEASDGDQGFELPQPGPERLASLKNPPVPVPEAVAALYRAAGERYGLPAALLAGIGMEETTHGANKSTSSAGARGLMQFMPATWSAYGVDGDGDGRADIGNDADSVFSAANYLTASGVGDGPEGVRRALFAYNHADWYVDDVLYYANAYGGGTVVGGTSTDTLSAMCAGLGTGPQVDPYDPSYFPVVSADGTYRVPKTGSGNVPEEFLCPVPWEQPGTRLRCDAAQALAGLDGEYYARFGVHLSLPGANAYRDLATQVTLKAKKGDLAATPGKSNHGWGLAADFGGLGHQGSTRYEWLWDNAGRYGWSHPSWARIGGEKPEYWHWEYIATKGSA